MQRVRAGRAPGPVVPCIGVGVGIGIGIDPAPFDWPVIIV